MREFIYRYPGLTPEQARIRHKIWLKEREEEEQRLLEALKRRDPFSSKEDDDMGDYDSSLYSDTQNGGMPVYGFVSDAPISGAKIIYSYSDGSSKWGLSDTNGRFKPFSDFRSGDLIVSGGIDTVTGILFQGELIIDAEFFLKYKTISPFTHIANHIWNNTDTKTPEEAMDLILEHFPGFIGIPIESIDKDKVFNDDHVKLTLEDIDGAKEIQAINTLIEIYSEIIGNTRANNQGEILQMKKKVYDEIAIGLLHRISHLTGSVHSIDLHDLNISDTHKECCTDLIDKAYSLIIGSIGKDSINATKNIQAINMAIKSEWAQKALAMTDNSDANKENVWDSIINKDPSNLLSQVNLPQV